MNENVDTKTSDIANSWIVIHCHEHKILLTDYTLKQGKFDSVGIKSWKLQGGMDGKEWTTISVHDNDTSLSKSRSAKTWTVKLFAYYNYFRILMTNYNCNGNWKLRIESIKFYGFVTSENKQCMSKICGYGELLDNDSKIIISTKYNEWHQENEKCLSVLLLFP